MDLGDAIKKACKIADLADKNGVDPQELRALTDSEALDYINKHNGPNTINKAVSTVPNPPVNDITNRVSPQANNELLLYPEKAALLKRQRAEEEKETFAKAVSNLKKVERENLSVLMQKGGRFVMDCKALEEMALAGDSLETENIEELGLIKRELIKDAGPFGGNMIQFRITSKGRQVYNLFKSQGIL